MIVELKEDLCENETIEFVWCAEQSMRIRFFEFVANDEFVICVWKKDDSELWNELKQILDVNKKSSRRISKSFTNCTNVNHKDSDTWSICNIARKIFEWEDDWSKRIRKILESKIREQQDRFSILLM
jgi:hypothetical protein